MRVHMTVDEYKSYAEAFLAITGDLEPGGRLAAFAACLCNLSANEFLERFPNPDVEVLEDGSIVLTTSPEKIVAANRAILKQAKAIAKLVKFGLMVLDLSRTVVDNLMTDFRLIFGKKSGDCVTRAEQEKANVDLMNELLTLMSEDQFTQWIVWIHKESAEFDIDRVHLDKMNNIRYRPFVFEVINQRRGLIHTKDVTLSIRVSRRS